MSLIYQHSSGGKLFQAGAQEIPDILKKEKISLLILAAEEYQPKDHFPTTKIIYAPLKDTIFLSPQELKETLSQANNAANNAASHLKQGKNVLITCWAGLNRSGLISGLTIKQFTNGSGKHALELIRKNRHWRALSNPLFAYAVVNLT